MKEQWLNLLENLIIKEKLKWTAYINPFSFNVKSPTVTVKVPIGSNFDAILKTDNGHITIGESNKNYSFKSLTAQTDNGAIYARPILAVENEVKFKTDNGEIVLNSNLNCSTLTVNTDNGKIEINGNINATNASLSNDNGLISIISDLTLSGKLTISNDNGQISMYNNVVANEIYIENDTGGINCENGCFLAKKITVKNDVGTISLTLKGKKEDYSCTLKTDVGKTNISSYTSGDNIVTVSTDVGDVNVFFTDTVKI